MLWTICVILSILWLLGLLNGYTMGNFIHILLAIAIILLVVRESFGDEKHCSDLDPCRRRYRFLERRVANRSGKILPQLAILSGEKISQPIISLQTHREE
jgi:hypothetical protein